MKREKLIILPQLNDCGGDIIKKWFIYYSFRNPLTGKMERIKTYKGLHKKKTAQARRSLAKKIALKITNDLKNGWDPLKNEDLVIYSDHLQYKTIGDIYGKKKSSNKNFNYYANLFTETQILSLNKKSISTYISRFRIFNMWLEKNNYSHYNITEINNDIIVDFFNFLILEKRHARRTTGKYKSLLNKLFEWIIKKGSLKINPITNIPENRRITDSKARPISRNDLDELKKLMEKEDPQLLLGALLMYYCFLRPRKELRLLKINEIDLIEGRINIPAERIKTGQSKSPLIPNDLLKILRKNYKIQNFDGNLYVFGKNGIPGIDHVSENNLTNRFNKIRDKLNLPKGYKYYSYKHTGNAALKRAGVSMQARQSQNGHSSEKSTEIYSNNIEGFDDSELFNSFPKF